MVGQVIGAMPASAPKILQAVLALKNFLCLVFALRKVAAGWGYYYSTRQVRPTSCSRSFNYN